MMFFGLLLGCGANIDFMISTAVHCSRVEDEYEILCEQKEYWDKICKTCEEEYEFDKEYKWTSTTLDDVVTSVRPITQYEQYTMETSDGLGELDIYYIPSHGENELVKDTLIVYSHGRYGSIEHYMPRTRFLHEAGYPQLIWDFRGYGKSMPETIATSAQYVQDAREVWEYSAQFATDVNRRIVYGKSAGAVTATEMALAAQQGEAGDIRPCALFLEAALTSTRQALESFTGLSVPGSFLSQGYFENDLRLAQYDGALLMMHGTKDRYFMLEHAKENFDLAKGPKEFWELPGVEHGVGPDGGVPEDGLGKYFAKMESFLQNKAPGCLASQ